MLAGALCCWTKASRGIIAHRGELMLPKINDMLYMQLERSPEEATYKARVTELDDERIWMEVPLCEETGKFGLFPIGEELDVFFSRNDGIKWHFRSRVEGKRNEAIRMLSIRKPNPDDMAKMQRRNYLRVQAQLETAVSTVDGVPFLACTEDVSGGGVSLTAAPKWGLREGQLLQCWLAVPFRNGTIEHIPFTGEIVRVRPLHEERNLIMMKFGQIAELDQQKLIRFCFERQIDARK